MKKIVQIIFIFILFTSTSIGQTSLISDENYRIIMNDYAVNLNSVLTAECPQGTTIDQFKKKIVNGELTLSSTAQASILNYAEPLKNYGTQFATIKNLTITTDAEKIFLSSFAPSIVIQDSKLIPHGILLGLTSYEIWECALNSFYTEQCGINAVVSDKSDIKGLTKACTTLLTQHAGDIGVLIMLNGFSECLDAHNNKIDVEENVTYANLMNNTSLKQKLIEFGADTQNIQNNELYVPEFGFSIVTDSIAYMGRATNHSYTFRIKRQSQTGEKKDENLVISKSNNQKYQAFLIQYDLTEEDKIAISNNIPISYTSKVKVYTGTTISGDCYEVTINIEDCCYNVHDATNAVEGNCECPQRPTSVIITTSVFPCQGGGGNTGNTGSTGGTGGAIGGNWGSSATAGGSPGNGSTGATGVGGSGSTPSTPNPHGPVQPIKQFITTPGTKFLVSKYEIFISKLNDVQRIWWEETAPVEIKTQIQSYLLYRTTDVDFALEIVSLAKDEPNLQENIKLINLSILVNQSDDKLFTDEFANSLDEYIDLDLGNPPPDIQPNMIGIKIYLDYRRLRKLNPEWSRVKCIWYASKEIVHLSLDTFGLIPVGGEIADLVNGALYTIEGDKLNATLSYASAIPILGWATASTKFGLKIINVANDVNTKVKLVWKIMPDGVTIYFGSASYCRSTLRKILGMAVGDTRQAHHIIPLNLQTNPVVQKAAKSASAFHMNELLNGIPLSTAVHNGSHAHYDGLIRDKLTDFIELYPNATPNQCYNEITDIINDIRTAINNNPSIPINQLNF